MKTKEAIVFSLLVLFAILPNILVVCLASDVTTVGARFLYCFQTLVLYAIGLALVHRRAYLYIVSLGFIFSVFELFHLFMRGKTMTMLYLYTWLKTSPEELNALYSPYIWLAFLGLVVWIGFYVLAHYFVAREYILPLRWRIPVAAVLVSIYMLVPMQVNPMNVVQRFGQVASMAIHVERTQPKQRQFSYGIVPKETKAQETLIVVLAETSYEQWRSLDFKDSLAIDFSEVYAKCPVSGVAVPMALSRATASHITPFFEEKSVIKAFDEAEFYTAWLSNYGYHDHFLMRIADDCRYLSYLPGEADTALLVPFREVMAQPALRHMAVLVTQGGHHDQSLAQTPALLRALTDSLRTVHQPAMMVYVGSPTIRLDNATSDLHVPFVVWTNPNYRYRHRPLIRSLQAQREQRFSTNVLFHSLLYWHSIDCPQLDNRLAIGHEQFEVADTIHYLDENLQVQALDFQSFCPKRCK